MVITDDDTESLLSLNRLVDHMLADQAMSAGSGVGSTIGRQTIQHGDC